MYEPDFEFVINNNEVLLKHIDLLKALSDDRIMCVGYEQNGNFYLMECCDEYFFIMTLLKRNVLSYHNYSMILHE